MDKIMKVSLWALSVSHLDEAHQCQHQKMTFQAAVKLINQLS